MAEVGGDGVDRGSAVHHVCRSGGSRGREAARVGEGAEGRVLHAAVALLLVAVKGLMYVDHDFGQT